MTMKLNILLGTGLHFLVHLPHKSLHIHNRFLVYAAKKTSRYWLHYSSLLMFNLFSTQTQLIDNGHLQEKFTGTLL